MDVAALVSRYERLKAKRDGYWLQVWQQARRFCMPTEQPDKTEGGERAADIFDTTAVQARQRLAAGMYNWMAPPEQRWFELSPRDRQLEKDDEVKKFFSEATRIVAEALANSNWSSVLIETLNNLACGLDGIVYCEDSADPDPLVFRCYPVETVCYAESAKGKVDTIFVELKMTARQMLQEFDEKNLPEKVIADARDNKLMDNEYVLLHAVFPRQKRNPKMIDAKNMPFADVYIDIQSKTVISEGGFVESPFAVCRFQKASNEQYGRGPGIDLLPDIRMLNRMRQAYIVGREKQSSPSYLVPDGTMVSKVFDTSPGAIIPYKRGMNGEKPEVLPNAADLLSLYRDIQEERTTVKQGFFWDIFDPLGDLRQITATEAEIRNEGKMIPFAPIAGNLHSELFAVIIHRVFGLLARQGKLPPVPEVLQDNSTYKINFVSKIARSLKKLEVLGWLQTEASLQNIMAIKPDVVDNFNLDEVSREIALVNGVNPAMLVPVRERKKIREKRAQQQAQQQAAAQLMQGAGILGNNLGKAPEPGSPLEAVMSGKGV
ncbi:MAG: head-tail connector protein [Lentisphaeria bacterium]|nr:head-tail connector protein [Lentisphaeria bacterium]